MISKAELDKLSYYMTFFEFAKKFSDENVYKRSLVAPTFDDFTSVKKRLSTVLLKGLRSSLMYKCGHEFTNGNETFIVHSITRRRGSSNSNLEQYMKFIVDIEFTKQADNFIQPSDRMDSGVDFTLIRDEGVKTDIINAIVGTSSDKCPEIKEVLLEEYEIGLTSSIIDARMYRRSSNQNILPNIENFRTSVIQDTTSTSLQQSVWSNSRYCLADRESAIAADLLIASAHSRSIRYDENKVFPRRESRRGQYRGNGMFSSLYYGANVREQLSTNIYIPVTHTDNRSGETGTIILCKKKVLEDGKVELTPTELSGRLKVEFIYSKESLMNPDLFVDVNRSVFNTISTNILGANNENVSTRAAN